MWFETSRVLGNLAQRVIPLPSGPLSTGLECQSMPGYKHFFHRPPVLVRDNSSGVMEEAEIEGESEQRKQEGLGNWYITHRQQAGGSPSRSPCPCAEFMDVGQVGLQVITPATWFAGYNFILWNQ